MWAAVVQQDQSREPAGTPQSMPLCGPRADTDSAAARSTSRPVIDRIVGVSCSFTLSEMDN